MRTVFFTLFAIFSLHASPDILIYAQDAGETLAFLPILEKLEEQGVDVVLLKGGVAETLTEKGISIETIVGFPIDKSWKRDDLLRPCCVKKIRKAFSPKIFLTGVAFSLEAQLLDAFPDAKTIAYWDNFSWKGDNPYFAKAKEVEKHADLLFVPSGHFAEAFPHRQDSLFVVGQPSLESWGEKILEKTESSKIVYIGGYGKDYEEAFDLFLRCIEGKELSIFIKYHPKTEGTFEKERVQNIAGTHVEEEIGTKELVQGANLVICHQSSVGMQALSIGVPVLYVMPDEQFFSIPALEYGVAKRVSNPETFGEEFARALQLSEVPFYEALNIPKGSDLFFETLQGQLKARLSR